MPSTTTAFRVSPQQERIFALQQPGSVTPYRAECTVLLEGHLDAQKLHSALNGLMARHEIFRTVFQRQAGVKVPFQVILENASPAAAGWDTADLNQIDQDNQQARLAALQEEARTRNLDLETGRSCMRFWLALGRIDTRLC